MKDIKTFLDMIKHLRELLSSQQKKKATFVFIQIIISALFETLGVSVILPFVQALTSPEQMMKKKYINYYMDLLNISTVGQLTVSLGIVIILVYVLKNLVLFFSSYVRIKFSTELCRDIAILIMNSYMNRPYEYFTYNNSSEILQGVNGDAYAIDAIVANLLQLMTEAAIVIMIGVYLFAVDPFLAAGILILALACAMIIVLILKKKMSKMGMANRQAAGEVNQIALHISNGIKEIHVSQKRKEFLDKFIRVEYRYSKTRMYNIVAGVMPERLIETVCIGGFIGVVLIKYMTSMDISGFVASLSVFAMAAFRVLPSISRISGYMSGLIFQRPSLDIAYNNVMTARNYIENTVESLDIEDQNAGLEFENEIRIEDVFWKYKNGKKNILRGLSLVIKKGESIGIIGESGAGKSTLSDILLGLYVPQKGNVTVDGHILTEIPKSWSKMMGYVPQSVYLMDDTLRANIAFGEEKTDDAKIWKALEQASLKTYVEGLPDGLDTMVGERGIRFSGGQCQRVAIARALYNNPSILILDEATSALDNETENAVMEAINSLQGKITMIIIAHRLTTIKKCDKIIKIEEGLATEIDKNTILV